MKEFNIGIYKLDSRKTTIGKSKFNKVLEEHKELWKDEIGTYKFKKINLKLKANNNSYFC